MLIRLIITLFATLALTMPSIAQQQPKIIHLVEQVVVCFGEAVAPPDFNASDCKVESLYELNPQGRVVWFKVNVELPSELIAAEAPLALRIGALASSEFYWNGELAGRNGIPGQSKTQETPGKLDAAIFIPQRLMKAGENQLVIKMSSFHNLIQVYSPVHYLYVAVASPTVSPLSFYYAPALLTAGAFVLAAVYFGLISTTDRRRFGTVLIALMALFAVGQLCAESLRGFVSYSYPWQIWRLIGVMFCAIGFALVMLIYVARRFQPKYWKALLIAAIAVVVLVVTFSPGFDFKTLFSLAALCLIALGAVIKPVFQNAKGALITAGALLGFLILIVMDQQAFLDRTFYFAAAMLTVAFFVDQAREMRRIRADRQIIRSRAEQLELELLRRRIAPHFLMNTLNALTEWVESDPATGVKMIDALAEEFRLLGQMSQQALVPLVDEVALCQRHLEVMSYRVDRKFSMEVENIDEKLAIPPGIIHTLIENAFTHGRFVGGAQFILNQSKTAGQIVLTLITPPVDAIRNADGASGGEGLAYVRKRLASAFGALASFTDGPGADGSWISRIAFTGTDS